MTNTNDSAGEQARRWALAHELAKITYETGFTAEEARGMLNLDEHGWQVFDKDHAALTAKDGPADAWRSAQD